MREAQIYPVNLQFSKQVHSSRQPEVDETSPIIQ
jgi:hypothetical protein